MGTDKRRTNAFFKLAWIRIIRNSIAIE